MAARRTGKKKSSRKSKKKTTATKKASKRKSPSRKAKASSTPAYTKAEREIEQVISEGGYADALKRIERIEAKDIPSVRVRELKGLALARLGRLADAQEILGALHDEGHRDPETLGIYARTCMDLYDTSGDRSQLLRSRDLYAEGFELNPGDFYTGINAAAKSVFLRDRKMSRKYANAVGKLVGTQPIRGDYWGTATVAEVQLILENYDAAASLYHSAVQQAPDDLGSHSSTWLQAKRLMTAMSTDAKYRASVEGAFRHLTDADPGAGVTTPPVRRLRVFAIDPSASRRTDTAAINEVTLRIAWESAKKERAESKADTETGSKQAGEKMSGALEPGPVGEYLEVVDYDPASDCFYEPVDLNDPNLLATDGLSPSEGNPQFHQQMVYGVAMNVIDHFEKALGRRALWSGNVEASSDGTQSQPQFVRRLRVYPHALREANAYYSPARKALLFGYFPAEVDDPQLMPGGMVFTCLSHDVIAHEMSHALLDGLHPYFAEPTNPDVLAFHEAFADLIALFQHFSHAEVLEHEIARTRGDLASENLLGQLAQEFGRSIGRYGSLRDAIGEIDPETRQWRPKEPDPEALRTTWEPHARGAILVAAVFDAFLTMYRARIEDLLRIATQGSGILAPGALHPDLVTRLAREAAKTANHMLGICIRALDYCPPIDIRFGDYLRAMITADVDSVPDDRLRYRIAIIEAFQRRGIYPDDVRTLSEQSLVWRPPRQQNGVDLSPLFEKGTDGGRLEPEWRPTSHREELWNKMRTNTRVVRDWSRSFLSSPVAEEIGLAIAADAPSGIYREHGRAAIEVHSVRLARRTTPTGDSVSDVVIELLQQRRGYLDADKQKTVDEKGPPKNDKPDFIFRGGCTLLVDPGTYRVRYSINKHILSDVRIERQRQYLTGEGTDLRATYFGDPTRETAAREPFGLLHRPIESQVQ